MKKPSKKPYLYGLSSDVRIRTRGWSPDLQIMISLKDAERMYLRMIESPDFRNVKLQRYAPDKLLVPSVKVKEVRRR